MPKVIVTQVNGGVYSEQFLGDVTFLLHDLETDVVNFAMLRADTIEPARSNKLKELQEAIITVRKFIVGGDNSGDILTDRACNPRYIGVE